MVLEREEERSIKLDKEIEHIKTLDGEGKWLLHMRGADTDNCVDTNKSGVVK